METTSREERKKKCKSCDSHRPRVIKHAKLLQELICSPSVEVRFWGTPRFPMNNKNVLLRWESNGEGTTIHHDTQKQWTLNNNNNNNVLNILGVGRSTTEFDQLPSEFKDLLLSHNEQFWHALLPQCSAFDPSQISTNRSYYQAALSHLFRSVWSWSGALMEATSVVSALTHWTDSVHETLTDHAAPTASSMASQNVRSLHPIVVDVHSKYCGTWATAYLSNCFQSATTAPQSMGGVALQKPVNGGRTNFFVSKWTSTSEVNQSTIPIVIVDHLPDSVEGVLAARTSPHPNPNSCSSNAMSIALFQCQHADVKSGLLDATVRELCNDKRYPYTPNDPTWCLARPFCFKFKSVHPFLPEEPITFLMVVFNVANTNEEQLRMGHLMGDFLNPPPFTSLRISGCTSKQYWDWEASPQPSSSKSRGRWLNRSMFKGFRWSPKHDFIDNWSPPVEDAGSLSSRGSTFGGPLLQRMLLTQQPSKKKWKLIPRRIPANLLSPTFLACRSSTDAIQTWTNNHRFAVTHNMIYEDLVTDTATLTLHFDLQCVVEMIQTGGSDWGEIVDDVWVSVVFPFLSIFDVFRCFSRVNKALHTCFEDLTHASKNQVAFLNRRDARSSFFSMLIARPDAVRKSLNPEARGETIVELHPLVAGDVRCNARCKGKFEEISTSIVFLRPVNVCPVDEVNRHRCLSVMMSDFQRSLKLGNPMVERPLDWALTPLMPSAFLFELEDPMLCASFREGLLGSELDPGQRWVLGSGARKRKWRPTSTPWCDEERSRFPLGGPDRPVFFVMRDQDQKCCICLLIPQQF